MVTPNMLAESDIAVLRRELALRILLQNLLLIVTVLLFAAFAILALAVPGSAWGSSAALGAATLGASLQWCHHGVRTKQIKIFLLSIECGGNGGWEQWLPSNRPNTLLGSRWLISTKGVFLGVQFAMILLAWRLAMSPDTVFAGFAIVMLLSSAAFLLTNPKE